MIEAAAMKADMTPKTAARYIHSRPPGGLAAT